MDIINYITGTDIRAALLITALVLEIGAIVSGVVYHESSIPRIEARARRSLLACWFGAALCGAAAVVWANQPDGIAGWALGLLFCAQIAFVVAGALLIVSVRIISPAARANWRANTRAERAGRDSSDDWHRRDNEFWGVNPSTGLPMYGGMIDTGGNPCGSGWPGSGDHRRNDDWHSSSSSSHDAWSSSSSSVGSDSWSSSSISDSFTSGIGSGIGSDF